MNVRATLIELWNRITPFNKSEKVYFNGDNNLYPNEIERVVSNSPTASMASSLMSKYIVGLGPINDEDIGGVKKSEIIKDIADDIAVQYGSFIHVGFGIEVDGDNFKIVPKTLKILDYIKCRKNKKDDNDNSGIIKYKDYEDKSLFGNTDETFYYPFSKDQDVIIEQIKADNKEALKKNPKMTIAEMLPKYRGQVYYLNLTPRYEYAVSKFNAVYHDCDTEYRLSVYSNVSTRGGFMGKIAILLSGLDEEFTKKIKEDVSEWLGSEKAGNIYLLELKDADGDLENHFKIIKVPTNFDEQQFKDTKKDIRINILGACNSLPNELVYTGDSSSLFGNGGTLIKEMKKVYTENTEYERNKIAETLTYLGWETHIVPLISLDKELEEEK